MKEKEVDFKKLFESSSLFKNTKKDMKENEPKVKDSQKWWDKNRLALSKGTSCTALREEHKATYDRLVTLEAKIELLNLFTKHYDDGERFLGFLEDHESELAELVKELNL